MFDHCILSLIGLHSFDIHLKQCKELWIAREAQKDPRERKPLPPDPFEAGGCADRTNLTPEQLQAINDKSSQQYNSVSLSQCQWCGRTFLPEKLVVHNRSCTQETPAKRIGGGGAADGRADDAAAPPAAARPRTAGRPASSRSSVRIEPVSATNASPVAGSIRPKKQQVVGDGESEDVRSGLAATHVAGAEGATGPLSATEPLGGDVRARAETIRYLSERVDEVEGAAVMLVKSIAEIKALLRQLQT